jgi:dipeptidyl aminopeptidase/acylaminoacyl peptidase
VQVPIFILYGLKDRNVYPKVAEEFFKVLKSDHKKIESLDCNHWYYDAVFYSQSKDYSEDDRRDFLAKVINWMDAATLPRSGE